jgi:replicative DNA helicase
LTFDNLKEKISLLETDDFYYSEHRKICQAMINQRNTCNSFDFITVANECGADYRAEIQNCIQLAISVQLFDEHFKLLKEMASKRRLIDSFNALRLDGNVSVSSLQKMIDDESTKKLTSNIEKTNERNLDEFVSGLNKRKGALMTGFGTIDKVIGGIRKSTVFIVGARPSTGKTTFALNIAANQLNDEDKKVMFFSLEMSSEMIYERLIAAKNQIEYEKFSRNNLSDIEIEIIKQQTEKLKTENRFFVIDDVYNVEQMCNLISENKPDLVVVDFMQIISAT